MGQQEVFIGLPDGGAQEPRGATDAHASGERLSLEWPRSLWLNLGFAATVGFLYSLWVMGPGPLNPRNVKWLTHDPSTHYLAWEFFRQDPKLHWPLTFTDRIGYPEGESISLMDPNPLFAVILKPFSPLLPQPFQYLGIEVVFACTLQVFFALLLFRLLLGPTPFAVVVPALFFLIAPPFTWRFAQGHFAGSNHWLILAALLMFCLAQQDAPHSISRFVAYAIVLTALAVAINPYIAFQVVFLLIAAVLALLWRRRLTLPRAATVIAALGSTCFAVASAFGLIIAGGQGYSSFGYRAYSLNILALLDSHGHDSFVPPMPRILEQYEGYNYLGLGVICLIIVALPIIARARHKFPAIDHRILLPLIGCCVVLTALALSTKVMFGSWMLIDLDPHQKLTPYLATFRASGRLFWAVYYILLATVLAVTLLWQRRAWAVAFVSAALVVQLADTHGLRGWAHFENNQRHPSPLRSPIWSKLGALHNNLMIMPPWQCGGASSPGGLDGYRIFGFLAAAQHLRTNSYYAGRYTEVNRQAQCGVDISAVAHQPLSPDSAYVVTPVLAQMIAEGPTGPGKCHDVDQFILCSTKTDFGLSAVLKDPAERLKNAIGDSGFEDGDLSYWPSYQDVTAVTSSDPVHGGTRNLAETGGVGSVYQDVSGLRPGRTYTVAAWVSGSSGATATGQIAIYDPGANIATFSSALRPGLDWQLIAHSVTVSALGTIRIHLFRNEGEGVVYWDDVSVYEIE